MLLTPIKPTTYVESALKIIDDVALLQSHEEAAELIEQLYNKPKPVILSFINAHAYNLCCIDKDFTNAMLQSDVILRDGIGMQLLYRSIGKDPGANLNGSDFIPFILDRHKGKRIALLGTKSPYLAKATANLTKLGHNIILTKDGFQPNDYYVELVKISKPDIVILGMGMPKQEKIALAIQEALDDKCLIVNGGAIIDFWGNKMYRAPMWLRRFKLEWFFRLAQEPRRLFSRYIIGNYTFLVRTRSLKKYVTRTKTFVINYSREEIIEKHLQRKSAVFNDAALP